MLDFDLWPQLSISILLFSSRLSPVLNELNLLKGKGKTMKLKMKIEKLADFFRVGRAYG